MEEVRSAMDEHMNQMADLVEKFSAELRSGLRPAYDNFIGFFHAIDWKEPWLICLMLSHAVLLIITIVSRRNINFQMCLFLLALAGVYLAERFNKFLAGNWKYFASQDYFDPHGLFLSVLWSGPLLVIAIIILERLIPSWRMPTSDVPVPLLHVVAFVPEMAAAYYILQVNTLFTLCQLMVRWKRAELRHRARLSQNKEE